MTLITLKVEEEDHTLGNIVTNHLLTNPEIEYAAYIMPHPLKREIIFKFKIIESTEKHYKQIFNESINSLINELK